MNVTVQGGPTASATLIGQFGAIGLVHLQVLTASATVRIGLAKQELEYSQNLPVTQAVGLQVPATSPLSITSLWWAGQLWAIGSVSGPSQIQVEFALIQGVLPSAVGTSPQWRYLGGMGRAASGQIQD